MKNLTSIFSTMIAIAVLLLVGTPSFAQKVKVKKGVIHVDKKPYMKVHVKKKVLAGLYKATYQSLDGQPLIEYHANSHTSSFGDPVHWLTFDFIGKDMKIDVNEESVQKIQKLIVRFFYNYNLIKDGQIDDEALAKIKADHPEDLTALYAKKAEEEKEWIAKLTMLPDRNIKRTVMLDGKNIVQDGVVLGSYKLVVSEGNINMGILGSHAHSTEQVEFSNPDGIPLAVQRGPTGVKTGRDGADHDLTRWVTPNANPEKRAVQIANFLVKNGYM